MWFQVVFWVVKKFGFILSDKYTLTAMIEFDFNPLNLFFLPAYISTGQIMGWGNKAIEIRAAETGHLDGVFMHKKAQKLKFLCERNDKVRDTTLSNIK